MVRIEMKLGGRSLTWCLAAAMVVGLAVVGPSVAQETAAPALPAPERVYAAKLDEVWDATLTFLKTRSLPIPVANAEKDKEQPKGTIITTPQRYFKIAAATFPPRQRDYRDTYTLTVTALAKGAPPPSAVPGVASLPPDKPVDLTKLIVQRKFEKFDKKANTWVELDPMKEKDKVGISAEDILHGVQLQLTPPPPPVPVDEE